MGSDFRSGAAMATQRPPTRARPNLAAAKTITLLFCRIKFEARFSLPLPLPALVTERKSNETEAAAGREKAARSHVPQSKVPAQLLI